jgi:hypothetical protein
MLSFGTNRRRKLQAGGLVRRRAVCLQALLLEEHGYHVAEGAKSA